MCFDDCCDCDCDFSDSEWCDNDDDRYDCQKFCGWFTGILMVLFLALFIVMYSLYGVLQEEYSSPLISIPIYPTSSEPEAPYIGIIPDNRTIYNISELGTISLPLEKAFIKTEEEGILSIVHNFYGFNFTGRVKKGNMTLHSFHSEQNLPGQEIKNTNFKKIQDLKIFHIENDFGIVYCPTNSLIVEEKRVYPECSNRCYMNVGNTKADTANLGSVSEAIGDSQVTVEFDNLIAYPNDFTNTPFAYLHFSCGSDLSPYLISGIVFTVLFVLVPIGPAIVACI